MADYRTIKAEPLTNAIRAIVKAGGSTDREAELVATNLVEANLKGHDSHGVGMVPRYVERVHEGGLAVERARQDRARQRARCSRSTAAPATAR